MDLPPALRKVRIKCAGQRCASTRWPAACSDGWLAWLRRLQARRWQRRCEVPSAQGSRRTGGAPGTRVHCVTRPHSIKQCSHVHIPARHSRKHHAGRGDRVVASGDKFSGLVRDRSSLRTDGGNDRYLLAREEARRRCKHIKAAQVTHRGRLVRQRPSQPPQHRSAALCAVQCVHGARQFPEGSLAHSRIGQSVQQGHQVGQGFGSIAGTREVLGKLRIRLLESMDRLQSDKMQA